jgi:hypothetical protein
LQVFQLETIFNDEAKQKELGVELNLRYTYIPAHDGLGFLGSAVKQPGPHWALWPEATKMLWSRACKKNHTSVIAPAIP